MGSDHDNYLGGELEEKRQVEMDSFSLHRQTNESQSNNCGTSLYGGSTPEKAAEDSIAPPLHHLITISNVPISNTAAVESKLLAKKFSFRSQISIDTRRMFLFFATIKKSQALLLNPFLSPSISPSRRRSSSRRATANRARPSPPPATATSLLGFGKKIGSFPAGFWFDFPDKKRRMKWGVFCFQKCTCEGRCPSCFIRCCGCSI